MSGVAFLMIAISFLMVAFLTAVATLNASPKVSRIANRVTPPGRRKMSAFKGNGSILLLGLAGFLYRLSPSLPQCRPWMSHAGEAARRTPVPGGLG